MSTLGSDVITTAELRSSIKQNGGDATVYEILEKNSYVVQQGRWVEGSLPNGNEAFYQATTATATKRDYERGVAKSKTNEITTIDLSMQYAANIEVDISKLETRPNPQAYLQRQEHRQIVAMNTDFEDSFFNGDPTTDVRDIKGLASRLSSISSTYGKPGYQVWDAGGSSNLTSLYLVGWGNGGVVLFYPLGSNQGISRIVKPQERVTDADGYVYYAYCVYNNWKVGMSVDDHHAGLLRVANISISDLETFGTADDTSPDLVGITMRALERVKIDPSLNYCWYGTEAVIGHLKNQCIHTPNVNLNLETLQGGFQTVRLGGIPVYKSYQISSSETEVS